MTPYKNEFNLSDKIYRQKSNNEERLNIEDVKEFINRLKEEINKEGNRIRDLPEFTEKHKFAKEFALTSYLMFLEPKIDILAGEKLKWHHTKN